MKLHQGMFFIVCLLSVTIHSMNQRSAILPKKLEIIRKQKHDEFKQVLDSRLAEFSDNPRQLNAPYRQQVHLNGMSSCYPGIPEEPLVELFTRYNYPDLLEQLLDKVPIQKHSDIYDSAFRESLRKNNLKIAQLLINRKINLNSIYMNDSGGVTPLILLVYEAGWNTYSLHGITRSIEGHTQNVIQLMKLLLMHGANPNLAVAGKNPLSVVVQHIQAIDLHEHDKVQMMKLVVEVLMMGGADHEKSIDSFPDTVHVAKPLDYACDELRSIMIECAQRRNGLFNDAAKDGDGINLINISLCQSVKDIYGNSLLFYALKNKNIKAATRLLCYVPESLSQCNFTGEFVWDDANALESLLTIFGLKQIEELHE